MKKTQQFLFSTLLAGAMVVGAAYAAPQAADVVAETLPAAIELAEGGIAPRTSLANSGVATERVFSSVRMENPYDHCTPAVSKTDTWNLADSNLETWGWVGVYMGVTDTDEATIDISNATDFYLQARCSAGGFPWLKWYAFDANGNAARVINYSACLGDLTDATTGKTIELSSLGTNINGNNSNWRGNWVGTTTTHSVRTTAVLHSLVADDWAVDASTSTTFDKKKVVAFGAVMHAFNAKTFDIGTLSAKINGEEVVLWDADKATEVSVAKAFSGETKNWGTISLHKNEWFFGNGNKTTCGVDPSSWATTETLKIKASYQKVDYNVFEYTRTSSINADVGTRWYAESDKAFEVNTATMDATNHNALEFNVDTTDAKTNSTIDFEIRLGSTSAGNDATYSNTGKAFLKWENGVVTTTNGYAIPNGFKGTFVLPFNQLKQMENSSVTLDQASSKVIAGIYPIVRAHASNTVGDIVKISDAKIVAYSDQEMNIMAAVTTFIDSFTMDEGVSLRLSDLAGLRFSVGVDNAAYEAVDAALAGVAHEFGTVIVPNEAAYENAQPNQADILTVKKKNSGANEKGTYRWYAAIVEINVANYERAFKAQAYLQYTIGDKTYTVWANGATGAYSVYDVAKAAVESGVTDNEYINGIIATVEAN